MASISRRRCVITTRHTPAALAASLHTRWQSPSQEQRQALGALVWEELLNAKVTELMPRASFDETFTTVLAAETTRAVWKSLPRTQVLTDLHYLRATDMTLAEALGHEGVELLRKGAGGPWKPNRELLERLLDQPLLRQALGNMVQKTFQQFLSQINPLAGGPSNSPGRGSVLGAIGRGLATRAEKAAQIGKTFMEGVGGGLYRQLEEQLQPFLAGFMNRSVKLLTEDLFEEGEQSEMAAEFRLHALDILLETPLSTLLPEPSMKSLEHNLKLSEAVAAHVVSLPGYRNSLKKLLDTLYDKAAHRTGRELLTRLQLPLEPDPVLLDALGQLGYHYLSRSSVKEFLEAELKAVW